MQQFELHHTQDGLFLESGQNTADLSPAGCGGIIQGQTEASSFSSRSISSSFLPFLRNT